MYELRTRCPLKSKSVLEIHFPGIWNVKNVKISPFTAHHGGTLGDTDLANSKETQSREKTAVDKSGWIKACSWDIDLGSKILLSISGDVP